MKRLLRILAGVVVGLGVLAGGTWVLSRTIGLHSTLYQGKSIYYWSGQLASRDAAASNKAAVVLYGRIIPHLTNEMFSDTNDSRLRLAVIDQLNELPGIHVTYAGAESRRIQAVNELGMFGLSATSAAPALLDVLKGKDEVLYEAAARALIKVRVEPEAAVPALIGCMVDEKGHGRPDVVEALGEYGPRAKAAVPALVKLLKDRSSKEIMRVAPQALKRIDPDAGAASREAPPEPQAHADLKRVDANPGATGGTTASPK
ncbi:MAG: HEAT repeat domain-containing protein [Limisphaerales bacterium]